jgi:N-dimethylarginine dimethylaminohydrolase
MVEHDRIMSAVLSEVGPLTRVQVKHARDAFVSQDLIDRQWKQLSFTAPPDFSRAVAEYDGFLEILMTSGAEIVSLPRDERVTLDSIYTRDASIVCSRGSILGNMGKPQRATEPAVQEYAFRCSGWPIAGQINAPGHLEGGDVVWLDERVMAVGWGYRTDAAGIHQLQVLLEQSIDEFLIVPLPHWGGPGDVMHLMSLVSPVDKDLAVVYSRLLPVPFREQLVRRGFELVEVPDEEFATMGANVLALAPRVCVMLKGNARTRARLERAGAVVHEYEGKEISLKGGGGPTCLTRPLLRSA